MKIVVPGFKMDLIELSTNKANVGCDAEIAEPRAGGPDWWKQCKNAGLFQW